MFCQERNPKTTGVFVQNSTIVRGLMIVASVKNPFLKEASWLILDDCTLVRGLTCAEPVRTLLVEAILLFMKPWTLATSCNVQQLSQCFFFMPFCWSGRIALSGGGNAAPFSSCCSLLFLHPAPKCVTVSNVLPRGASLCRKICSKSEMFSASHLAQAAVKPHSLSWHVQHGTHRYFYKTLAEIFSFLWQRGFTWSVWNASGWEKEKRSHQNVFEEQFRLMQLLLSKPKLKILLFSRTCAIIPLPQGCLPFYGSMPMCGVKEKNRLFLAQAREKLLTT